MDIKLLPIDDVKIELLKKWQNDINIKYPLMGFRFPIQKNSIENWLEGIRKENGSNRVVYGIFIDSSALGMISIHDIDYINSNAMFGVYVAERKENNKGVGFNATMLALDFAFNAMGLHRIGLDVVKTNKNAIHLYEKIGFLKEGVKREAFFCDGKYFDVDIMSIFKDAFTIDKNKFKNRLVLDCD